MAFNPVPWAITGSQLDTFVMREFANFATRDTEGIQLPGDAKVTASGTPAISIAAGGVLVRNAQAAAAGDGQSYVGRVTSSTSVAIPPTSGSGRSDLIICTVKDPDFSPWSPWPEGTDPNIVKFGPYFFPERISGVSGLTLRANQVVSYSAYALARVDIPAGTTNITNAMITDLRALAQPRIGFAQAVQAAPGVNENVLVTDTTYKNWPSNTLSLTVPTWATHCVCQIQINQVQAQGAGDFASRINFGGLTGSSANFDYNGALQTAVPGAVEGIPFTLAADIDVRTLQGQTVVVRPQVQRIFTANTGSIWINPNQQVIFDMRFVERTV